MLIFVIQILWLCLIRNLMMWSSCILSAGCIRSTESFVFLFSTSSKCFSQPSTTRSELPYTRNKAMTESALLKIIIWIICKQMARNTNTLSYNHHLSLWLPILHCTSLLLYANNINWKDLECQPLPAALRKRSASWTIWGKKNGFVVKAFGLDSRDLCLNRGSAIISFVTLNK